MDFKVKAAPAEWDPSITTVSPQGSIDALTASYFEKELLALAAKGRRKILVDCAQVDFISSAGIGVLMVVFGEVEKDGFLKVMNLSDEVHESFDLLGVPEVMAIYKNEKEARKALA